MSADGLVLLQFVDRLGLNLFAALTIGVALHAALGVVERAAFERLRWLITAAAIAALAFLGLRFFILLSQLGDGSQLFDPELVPFAWAALGDSSLLTGAGALLGAAGIWFGSRMACLAGAVLAGAGFAFTGHTQGLADPGPAPLALAAHVIIAGFWIAAPVTLHPVAQPDLPSLAARLKRFSALAVAAIPVLILLGVWLTSVLTGGWDRVAGSVYGQLLLAKLAVGLGGMAVGAVNKQVVTGVLQRSPQAGRRWLEITLGAEAALFLGAIVIVSAATTLTGPPE